ncbi:Aspartate-proton symporter [Aquicella siphonis]|uniref:Aspartate-proton symporter n=1 Tax=Aquicella siphonis TaxID=254247 RepID=A0A5E4PKC3_9COXI|nr:APC family permease [Aquicella siphonis]VVC77005.1 Aspartate-proton symporter [Aquicella siphonis]
MTLNRRFTPVSLLMLSINGMVGSAWLFAPLYAAKIAGSSAVIAWLIGGVATAIIALTFAELSVLFPVAGGTAQIPQMSHGTFTSFIVSWIAWLSALTMAPIEVQAILQYASTYFTSIVNIENGIPVLNGAGMVWATILMLAFCIINIASYKGLVRFNFGLFLFKVLVIILTVFVLIKTSFNTVNFSGAATGAFTLTGWHAILTAVASGGVAFAFTGFKHGVELAGETKNLAVAIPLAIVGSVIGCLILYLGLQVAFIGALSPNMLVNGWQHLSFAGDVGPFAGLAAGLGLAWLVKLLYIDAAVSPGGAGLIYVTSTARILYAMSQIGYLPRWLQILNKQNFPVTAILVNFVLGMFLFLPLPGWQAMVSFLVSGMVISYAMGPVALLCMRIEMPHEKRGFKLPAAKIICPCAFYFCNLLSYWCGWETIYKLAIAMAIGIVFFVTASLRGRLNVPGGLGLRSGMWMAPYLGGLVLISYLGAFGGKNIIPFGWDFLVIAIFSVVILYFAVKNRASVTEQILDQRLAAISTF